MNIQTANKLMKLRKEKGYTQESLADALGISRQAISKWERAEASPDTDNLICLAKLYGVSLDELLDTEEAYEDIKNSESYENSYDKEINISPRGIRINNGNKEDEKANKIVDIIYGVWSLIIFAVYLFLGFKEELWHPAWILFILVPVVPSIIECFLKKKITVFNYPLLITAVYLFIGCVYNMWHPTWILFVSIPVFYAAFTPIEKLFNKNSDEKDDEK